jgi:hypothetical protein
VSTTLGEEIAGGRALRCRYIRRSGDRCSNEIAAPVNVDDQAAVLLCPKHLHRAWQQFTEALEQAKGAVR